MSDSIHRFIFDDYNIRGEWVDLQQSVSRLIEGHDYPVPVAKLLQQMSAVAVLLATTLKFEGKMSVQLQTPGALRLATLQINHQLGFRGVARIDEMQGKVGSDFKSLTEGGQLLITIEPKTGRRYQGIVPLEGNSLAECIEQYFSRSEQLQTKIWLFQSPQKICGLLIQALPDMTQQDNFEHLTYLANTLSDEEALSLDKDVILHRLFHQEKVKLLASSEVSFYCGCSEKKILDSLVLMPREELQEILKEKGSIQVKCEFCLSQYRFDELALKQHQQPRGSDSQH